MCKVATFDEFLCNICYNECNFIKVYFWSLYTSCHCTDYQVPDNEEDSCIKNDDEDNHFCDEGYKDDDDMVPISSHQKKMDSKFVSSFISFFVCLLNSTKDRRVVVRGHPPDSNGNRNTKLT